MKLKKKPFFALKQCEYCHENFKPSISLQRFCSYSHRNLAFGPRIHKPKSSESNRKNQLSSKYGITPEQWDKIFTDQEHRCAICRSDYPKRKDGHWCTDHIHGTKRVRGILCNTCNINMGGYDKISQNPDAMRYVERSKNES